MKKVEVLKVGDRMTFSTELLEQLKQDGDRQQVVTVTNIVTTYEGLKIVYLQRVDE